MVMLVPRPPVPSPPLPSQVPAPLWAPDFRSSLPVAYRGGSIAVGDPPLWLDPQMPKDFAIVSHGHSDHIAPHRRALMTPETAAIYRHRHLEAGPVIELAYGEPCEVEGREIRLFPAGHILGSAMVWISDGTTSVLYTGDYKLRESLTAVSAAPPLADILITETTFALPNYRFPDPVWLRSAIVTFVQACLAEGETPVFLGYPLGKSQELAAILCRHDIPVAVQQSIGSICRIYERAGITFPGLSVYQQGAAPDCALVLTENPKLPGLLAGLQKPRVAYCSGWAMAEKPFTGVQADLSLPFSDHADFPELLQLVEAVQPRQVCTVHGFTKEAATILRRYGIPAQPLAAAPG